MKRNYVKYTSGAILTGLILFTSCQSTREVQANYEVAQIEGTRICMDSTWDAHPDEKAAVLLKPYKEKIDKMMYEVIGVSEMTMDKGRPESLLSNLVAEVLRLSAERVLKHPADIGIMNMGGLRNILPQGDITVDAVFEILPFENSLCVLTMKGTEIKRLVEVIASLHGEGLSGAHLEITEDGKLLKATVQGKEIEVDAVCDGTDILIPGIMEHIERTGIHSGDSISVYPAPTISEPVKEMIVEYTKRLAQALHVIGLINIQFIVMDEQVYVIEVNPRSSRTVPYISKVTGIPIVDLATKVIIGETIRGMGYEPGLAPTADYIAIKMPVFSFEKLRGAEISLGPEMKSTGECLGIAKTFNEALYKAFLGAGIKLPKYKQMIMTVKDADKPEAVGVAKRFEALGYKIYATRSTAKYLQEHGVNALRINKISQESPNVMDLILGHKIDLVIDTPTQGNGDKNRDGFLIRRNAIETGVYCITAMDTANALAQSLETATNELTPIDIATVKNL